MENEDIQEKNNIDEVKVRCEDFLGSIGDGVVATDKDGKIIFANNAAERMLGWKSGELIGKLLTERCIVFNEKGGLVPEENCPLSEVISKSAPIQSSSYFYMRKDGSKFPVSITITPVLVKNDIIGVIDMFKDITKEREAERVRMDFLVLASHQLRTPLSGIKWMIETLKRGTLGQFNDKQEEYIDKIYNVNEKMIKIVSEMFSVLNLEGDSIFIEMSKVSVEKICEDAIILMTPVAKESGIVLQCISKISAKVETDHKIVSTIINYLISNAINYSFTGGKVILDFKEEDDKILLSVKDEGIGILEDEKDKIFDKFFRGSNAKYFKPNGTGLGLAIAKSLAEKIGAKISFKSEKDKGSTFYLFIPKKSDKFKYVEKGNIKIKNITNL